MAKTIFQQAKKAAYLLTAAAITLSSSLSIVHTVNALHEESIQAHSVGVQQTGFAYQTVPSMVDDEVERRESEIALYSGEGDYKKAKPTATPITRKPTATPDLSKMISMDQCVKFHKSDTTEPYVHLSDRIPLAVPLERVVLTDWEIYTLQHLLPLVSVIERSANWYCQDPLATAQVLLVESSMYPLATNTYSNDFGLAQIKIPDFNRFYAEGLDPASRYYSPELLNDKDIFDPETNIIVYSIINSYNKERTNYTDLVSLYAVYSRGLEAVNPDGSLADYAVSVGQAVQDRYEYLKRIVPLLGLSVDQIVKIPDPNIRAALYINSHHPSPALSYDLLMIYDIEYLKKRDFSTGLTWLDCFYFIDGVQFATVLSENYGIDESLPFNDLKVIGANIEYYLGQAPEEMLPYFQQYMDLLAKKAPN